MENSNLMTEFFKHLFLGFDFLFMHMMHVPCIDEELQTNHGVKAV